MLFLIQLFRRPWKREGVSGDAALCRQGMSVLALHLLLLMFALMSWWPLVIKGEDSYQLNKLMITGVIGGGLVAALWLWLLVRRFQRTEWLRWVIVDFFITGLWGVLLAVTYILWTFNVQADYHYGTPERIERVVVQRSCEVYCPKPVGIPISYIFLDEECTSTQRMKKLEEYQKNHPECRVDIRFILGIPRWEDAQSEVFEFVVSEEIYNNSPIGTSMVVPYYYGLLGIRWFERDLILPAHLYGKNTSDQQRSQPKK